MAELEYALDSAGVDMREKRESVLGHIGAELDRLAATITELESRLHPVLSPFATVDGLAAVPQTPQSVIRDHRDGLSSQIGRLQRVLDQLEV